MPANKFKPLKRNPFGKVAGVEGFFTPNYTYRVKSTCPGNLIAYWPLSETTGFTIQDETGNGRTGSYNNVTLEQIGIGDGRTGVGTLGLTSGLGNLYSTSFRDAFNPREGTISVWFRVVNLAAWGDNQDRRVFTIGNSGSNSIFFFKNGSVSSSLQARYVANNTINTWSIGTTSSSIGWEHFAITFSRSASEVVYYYQGISRETDTSMGDFVGALNDATAFLFRGTASNATGNIWSGSACHMAVWTTPLTANQVRDLSRIY